MVATRPPQRGHHSDKPIAYNGENSSADNGEFSFAVDRELESTRSPVELAYWRGDSSLDSALDYLIDNPLIDEKIQYAQKKIYDLAVLGGKSK